ncbi:MAG: c-type cytochrome [Planctomycetes bacterium]|nr:c-type cytochrome [Planctomycetota bacterium]
MRYLLLAGALVSVTSAARAVEPSDLKPGLITTYSSFTSGEEPKRVRRLEPTPAVALAKGESPHPEVGSVGEIVWRGHINITRSGKYTFDAEWQGGQLQINVDGKGALGGKILQLEGGVVPIEVTFRRTARDEGTLVKVTWQGPGFTREPLAYQFLGHLPKDRPATFDRDGAVEHGRFKFEELACIKCHKPATNDAGAKLLVDRTGPNLTDVAKRAYPGWIYTWLADPARLRPHTTMPKSFTADATGTAERYAVTQYLVALAGKPLDVVKLPTIPPKDVSQSLDRGRVLYHVTGCAACHNDPIAKKKKDEDDEKLPLAPNEFVFGLNTLAGPTAKYGLGALGSKFTPPTLAAYLQDPLKTNPHGRMPKMNLSQAEALDIARYLCRTQEESVTPDKLPLPELRPADLAKTLLADATAAQKKRFDELVPAMQWAELGSRVVAAKGCINCHTIEEKGKPRAALDTFGSLNDIKKAGAKGCLDEKPDVAKVPVYKLDAKERDALATFVKEGLSTSAAPMPTYQARAALKRFNCLNCHQRDGEGGIPVELAEQMRLMEKSENADDVRPPVLTGIGHKTRTTWLRSVLTQSGRARPWMQLRMPQYGDATVGFLPEALAALEGTTTDDKVHVVPRTNEKLAVGRAIIGKGGLGCISCHDIGGIANTGTRGPDLATINQRVRYEWYERWLSQPLRMAPGTRMPQSFVEGKSTLKSVYDGDPKKQAEAMWAYLALGPGLPLPDGLEPPKGLLIAVRDRPEILRTFMPDAGTKAVAVGYPGYTSIAFSADQCRTAYGWGGNFLDATPVWNGRGGAPAKLLGPKFWTAPPGHPWGLTANPLIPPDFLARANNPAFGLALPLEPPRVYSGPMAVKFDGYSLNKDGLPTFKYRLDESGKGAELLVAETPVPLKSLLAPGLGRTFDALVPGGYQAWFFAGQTAKEPRLYDATGKLMKLDTKAEEVLGPAVGTRLVLPGDGDRAVVFEAAGAPAGTSWRLVPVRTGGWLAILKFPNAKDEQKLNFALNLYALPKDDDALLKELFAK